MKTLLAFLLLIFLSPLGTALGCSDVKQNKIKTVLLTTQPVLPKLKVTVGEKSFIVSLIDSPTTREFVNQLPLTLRMSDINDREKYSGLPDKLSGEGVVSTTYQIGDLSYWRGGGIAAFYNHDGREVKAGLIVLARLGKNVAHFNTASSIKVTFAITD